MEAVIDSADVMEECGELRLFDDFISDKRLAERTQSSELNGFLLERLRSDHLFYLAFKAELITKLTVE